MPLRVLKHFLVAAACVVAVPALAAPVARDHVEVELVAERDAVAPGGTVLVGLRIAHEPHWHTYWINPGDSGLATRLRWTLPEGVVAGDIRWPAPHRLPLGPLTNFGYDGEIVLPVEIAVDAGVPAGATLPLSVHASWLVCKEECIPGDATLALELPVRADGGAPVAAHAALFAAARDAAPRGDAGWTATLRRDGDALAVDVEARGAALDPATLELFPVPQQVFGTARGIVAATRDDAATITTPISDAFVSLPATVDLVFAQGEGAARRAVLVQATASDSAASAPASAGSDPGAIATPAAATAGDAPASLLVALVLALAGGVLLNLMPCVFPVLALKALGLAESAHDRAQARREGLAYLAGVVASFVALALVLVALRAGGAALGWGFQLQSPWVVAVLALLMVATGLSLSGIWAPGGAWSGVGQSLAQRGGARGAFFTGVLAVVVASPCTAPFMGPALGYAVTQGTPVALAVFATLGFGLALPLVALAFVPALARALPRPGPWMDTLKQVLAFPMYLAAVWLFWVLGRQAGVDAMAQALLAALALGFALWLLGRPATTRAARAARAFAIAAGLAACTFAIATMEPHAPAAGVAHEGREPWTGARLASLRAEGRPVFVNMTAAWCITCLANERVALSSGAVRAAFARHDVAYLEGDWTQRDAAITAYLAQFGRNGVPLYVLYPRGGGEPRVLPQMLTPGLVLAALADADARVASQSAATSPP